MSLPAQGVEHGEDGEGVYLVVVGQQVFETGEHGLAYTNFGQVVAGWSGQFVDVVMLFHDDAGGLGIARRWSGPRLPRIDQRGRRVFQTGFPAYGQPDYVKGFQADCQQIFQFRRRALFQERCGPSSVSSSARDIEGNFSGVLLMTVSRFCCAHNNCRNLVNALGSFLQFGKERLLAALLVQRFEQRFGPRDENSPTSRSTMGSGLCSAAGYV